MLREDTGTRLQQLTLIKSGDNLTNNGNSDGLNEAGNEVHKSSVHHTERRLCTLGWDLIWRSSLCRGDQVDMKVTEWP
jgi:hypothetical protein